MLRSSVVFFAIQARAAIKVKRPAASLGMAMMGELD
jgi:hypothetical protein